MTTLLIIRVLSVRRCGRTRANAVCRFDDDDRSFINLNGKHLDGLISAADSNERANPRVEVSSDRNANANETLTHSRQDVHSRGHNARIEIYDVEVSRDVPPGGEGEGSRLAVVPRDGT